MKKIGTKWILTFAFLLLCNFSFAKEIKRIVSLAPSFTEIVCALDAQDLLVGRTDFCNFPSSVLKIESVGGFDGKTIGFEKIISLNPDLVLLTSGMHDYLIEPLKKNNIKVYASSPSSIKEIQNDVMNIANYIEKTELAQNLVLKMNNIIEENRKKFENLNVSKPNVAFFVCETPCFVAGKNSFINEIITLSGAKNAFGDIEDAYPVITEEEFLLRKIDYIFCIMEESEKIEKRKSKFGKYATKGIYNLANIDLYSRPTLRCVDAIEQLADFLLSQ